MTDDRLYHLYETHTLRSSKGEILKTVETAGDKMFQDIQIASNELRISVVLEAQKQIDNINEDDSIPDYKKKYLTDHVNMRKNEKLMIIQQGKDSLSKLVESALFRGVLQKALYEQEHTEAN